MTKLSKQVADVATMAVAMLVAFWVKGPEWTVGSTAIAFLVMVAVYIAIKLAGLVIGTMRDTKKEHPPQRRGERS